MKLVGINENVLPTFDNTRASPNILALLVTRIKYEAGYEHKFDKTCTSQPRCGDFLCAAKKKKRTNGEQNEQNAFSN